MTPTRAHRTLLALVAALTVAAAPVAAQDEAVNETTTDESANDTTGNDTGATGPGGNTTSPPENAGGAGGAGGEGATGGDENAEESIGPEPDTGRPILIGVVLALLVSIGAFVWVRRYYEP